MADVINPIDALYDENNNDAIILFIPAPQEAVTEGQQGTVSIHWS